MAKASTTGVCGTSLPRMLNSQRHRVRIGHDQRIGAELFQLGAQPRELVRGRLAGIAQIVQHDGAERRRRPVGPAGVDRIVGDGNEACARGFASFAEPLGAVDRMQPGRIAELGAGAKDCPRSMPPADARPDARWRKAAVVDLVAHLHLIAAVDEQHRAVGEHDGGAGRAGEAGEPGEPLGAGRHIFVLIAVGARHDEAVEAAPLELRPQRGKPRRGVGALAAILERLKTGFEHAGAIYGSRRRRAMLARAMRRARRPASSSRRASMRRSSRSGR